MPRRAIVGYRIPGVSAVTAPEAARWHGRKLRLGKDVATSYPDTYRHPRDRPRTAPADLGLQPTARLEVTEVSCAGASWAAPGGLLRRVLGGRLYTVWNVVFFELRRLADISGDG